MYSVVQQEFRDNNNTRDYPYVFVLFLDNRFAGSRNEIGEEIIGWCEERFGNPGERWNNSLYIFSFRHEADGFEFKMRWC